jgi:hypothetical protein
VGRCLTFAACAMTAVIDAHDERIRDGLEPVALHLARH